MRIARIEHLAASAGWRIHDFLKVTLTDGLVGWSEFSRAFGGPGVLDAIAEIAPTLLGLDPRSIELNTALLHAARRSTITLQASGALRNALLDVRARALGIPVHELLGGALRDRVRLYWAHCGTYRVSHAELMHRPPLRTLDDLVAQGREVAERGYSALKTNLLLFDAGGGRRYAPLQPGNLASLSAEPGLATALTDQLVALRQGAGADVQLMVDLGSNFRLAGARAMIDAIAALQPTWVELEGLGSRSLRDLRTQTTVPIASGEMLPARDYHDLLRAGAVDVAIVDVLFNGLADALHVAAAADGHDLTIAVHNCYGPLATLMNAAFAAVAPNLQLMEHDVDTVPWSAAFVTAPARIEHGHVLLPAGPGWGAEVDEAAVRAHPVHDRRA
jgi:L-alanine-DL-glutamate epimerase-like enolase superfamily enzyme